MKQEPLLDELLAGLAGQRQFLEMLTGSLAAAYESSGGTIHCARGCSGCCSLVVNCTMAEAFAIARLLDEERALLVDAHVERLKGLLAGVDDLKGYLRSHRQKSGGCPLLERDGSCGIYAGRPISCRALLSTREKRWCVTDFARLSSEEKRMFMESLDREAAFPTHYFASTRDAGAEMENGLSMAMAAACGFSIYGNMPVLIHLARRHDLAGALSSGRKGVEKLLQATGLDNPLLLQMEQV